MILSCQSACGMSACETLVTGQQPSNPSQASPKLIEGRATRYQYLYVVFAVALKSWGEEGLSACSIQIYQFPNESVVTTIPIKNPKYIWYVVLYETCTYMMAHVASGTPTQHHVAYYYQWCALPKSIKYACKRHRVDGSAHHVLHLVGFTSQAKPR